jgi:dolichol-phosphate mannosyltransferase
VEVEGPERDGLQGPGEPVLSVVVPTYNERDNVRALVYRLRRALAYIQHEILFVDDSTDETPQVIAEQALQYPNIRMHHRHGERGLATAVLAGFRLARGVFVCVIDADLQHPPELLPAMLDVLARERSDLVVASRYVPGGSAAGLHGWWRRCASLACRQLVHALFPETRCTTDPLSGYFMFRRGLVNVESLAPVGFKILLELLVRAPHARVQDLPYVFAPRLREGSKAGLRPAIQFTQHIVRLKMRERPPRAPRPMDPVTRRSLSA